MYHGISVGAFSIAGGCMQMVCQYEDSRVDRILLLRVHSDIDDGTSYVK